jgi:hypothetical protein
MKIWLHCRGTSSAVLSAIIFVTCLLGAPGVVAQATGSDAPAPSSQSSDQPADHPSAKDGAPQNSPDGATTKLRILVTSNADKPIGNASVYVRYNASGGFLHHDKLVEMDLKTNQDGSVKVPAVPQGKVMVQVVAPGWHTYGKWYDIDKSEQVISIKLDPPPHWY